MIELLDLSVWLTRKGQMMNWKSLLNGLLTAGLTGGAATAGAIYIDPEHFNFTSLKHLGLVFAAGAIAAVLNWLRQSPWRQSAAALLVPLLLIAGAVSTTSCAAFTPPPNLNPDGRQAFYQAHAQQPLDLLRDAAVDATRTGLLARDSELKVVSVHRQAIVTIHDATAGWRQVVRDGLTSLLSDLPSQDAATLRPYIAAALSWLQEAQ